MNRREFCKQSAWLITTSLLGTKGFCSSLPPGAAKVNSRKVIVLGIDGLDPNLLRSFMDRGMMPHFQRLISAGGDLREMRTTIPAQSPVAWASFSTCTNPGRHGIFDFIHRQPDTFELYLSTSRTYEPQGEKFEIGKWVFSLKSGEIKNLVGERPFWNYLTEAGIPAVIYRTPSNFPPFAGKAWEMSGMGTPDIMGTYGTFSYYTDTPPKNSGKITGGKVFPTFLKNNGIAENYLYGPQNSFRLDEKEPFDEVDGRKHYNYEKLTIPFKVYVDQEHAVAKIVVQDKEIFLQQGEWSGWVEVRFELIPHVKHLSGIVKFYLKEVRPHFKLYVSPININPAHPALPIFNPPEYGEALVKDLGLFYTQGMAEDTKARTYGILDDREYWSQSQMVTADWFRAWRWHLDRFREGFLFFYFSTLDLGQHMFWRYLDHVSPIHEQALKSGLKDPVERLYRQMDEALGMVLQKIDAQTTLIVISDHGFTGFRRCFNLNSWLLDNGYLSLLDPAQREKAEYFENVDWNRTRAYGLGINGLYLNLENREFKGIVRPDQEAGLLTELKRKLEMLIDPKTGEHPLKHAYIAKEVYKGKYVGTFSPDIILGFRRGYRASWETILGGVPKDWFTDNLDPWSGDHCIDPTEVPATLVTTKKIKKSSPAIWDIGPTVLNEFGIKIPENLEGKPIF
jgi:predicted AlkP superfamily phosphohydrolase/phosphomutase